jgi:hypothetical protein
MTLQTERHLAARARKKEELRERVRSNREQAQGVVESLRATQAICDAWGDDEARAIMAELWEENKRNLPDYAWE